MLLGKLSFVFLNDDDDVGVQKDDDDDNNNNYSCKYKALVNL
jgi:hypothetical protein